MPRPTASRPVLAGRWSEVLITPDCPHRDAAIALPGGSANPSAGVHCDRLVVGWW